MLNDNPQVITRNETEASKLYNMLKACPIGTAIDYDSMSKIIGRDVQAEARQSLRKARQRLLKEHGAVFEAIMGVGVKRIDDNGKLDRQHAFSRRISKACKRRQDELKTIDVEKLAPDRVSDAYSQMAMVGFLKHALSTQAGNQIVAAQQQKALDGGDKLSLKEAGLATISAIQK